MKILVRTIAAFLVIQNAWGSLISISGPVENPKTGNTYHLLEASGWNDAETQAQAMGGHLVTVSDDQEQSWLVSTFSIYGGEDRFLWIGLNDAATEGTWTWANGEPVTYTHWWIWEPNSLSSEEDYVQMFGVNNNQGIPAGYWNDVYDAAYPYQGAASGHNFGPVYGVVEIAAVPELANTDALMLGVVVLLIGLHHIKRIACWAAGRRFYRVVKLP